ncbi:MAG: hypothetical protein A2168_05155 [Planctomycetes bacterium RBG_13_50_24]|nr:MAG: hypothetical protein A2168_05155 [Planctomycetes bacterium RBG_13_50_24]
MISRRSLFLLLVSVSCFSAILLVCIGARRPSAVHKPPLPEQVLTGRDTRYRTRKPERLDKIRVPADVSLDLVNSSKPGGPVMILISASSQIPVGSGILKLKIPQIGGIPAETQVLWSKAPSDFVAETVEYTIDSLPAGQYHFIAIFEFTPDSKNAGELFTSKSLYLDVRPTKILSSNISFNQIKRVELRKELEHRVLMDLKQNSSAIGMKTVAREVMTAENLDPDILASRIAELKVSDPEVARRIMELNQIKAVPGVGFDTIDTNEKIQQAFEDVVYVPEGLQD